MRTCQTCQYFEQTDRLLGHLGQCNLALPPWLASLLDLDLCGTRATRKDDTCSFREPPEIGGDEIDWENIYGVGGQG